MPKLFLSPPLLTLTNGLEKDHQQKPAEPFLRVEKITARWNADDKLPTLKDISVDLKAGDLLAVIGAVGSSKVGFLNIFVFFTTNLIAFI